MEQGVNYPNLSQIESPIPAMRAAGEVLFNCWLRLNDGTWQHFDVGQRSGSFVHVESDGGSVARDAAAMWGAL